LGRAIFDCFELSGELLQHCPGSTPGTILEKFSGDPGISVMVPAAHRLRIWVQIWAQFLLQAIEMLNYSSARSAQGMEASNTVLGTSALAIRVPSVAGPLPWSDLRLKLSVM
jgi:hypothetical protein